MPVDEAVGRIGRRSELLGLGAVFGPLVLDNVPALLVPGFLQSVGIRRHHQSGCYK